MLPIPSTTKVTSRVVHAEAFRTTPLVLTNHFQDNTSCVSCEEYYADISSFYDQAIYHK